MNHPPHVALPSTIRHPMTSPPMRDLNEIRDELRRFAAERDWEQFHSPKNLVMALMVETAELAEHFQWRTEEESERLAEETLVATREELADVLFYLVRLADRLGVDLPAAAADKLIKNAQRYPADRVRGQAKKYDEY